MKIDLLGNECKRKLVVDFDIVSIDLRVKSCEVTILWFLVKI